MGRWEEEEGECRGEGGGGRRVFQQAPGRKKHQESVEALENQSWETCLVKQADNAIFNRIKSIVLAQTFSF